MQADHGANIGFNRLRRRSVQFLGGATLLLLLVVLLAQHEGLLVRLFQRVALLLLERRGEAAPQRRVAAQGDLETVQGPGRALLQHLVGRVVREAPLQHLVAVGSQKQGFVIV
jgi:hypothetical protein